MRLFHLQAPTTPKLAATITQDRDVRALYLAAASDGTVTIWVSPAGEPNLDDSHRWLIAEDMVGGVARTLWANGGSARRSLHRGDRIWISSGAGDVNVGIDV